MSTVSQTNPYDALGLGGTATTAKKSTNDLGSEDFLNLMMTQLKYQDPTKPMDSAAFLGQIAQFSTVSGISDLQKSFSDFASSLYSNQALQASGLIGHSVLAPTGAGYLGAGGAIDGAVDLPTSAAQVTVSIYDGAGQLVRTVALGAQPAGLAAFHWDGKTNDGSVAAPGVYTVTADAQIDGNDEAVDALVAADVQSVSLGKNGSSLTLNLSGLGSVNFSDVRQIM